MKSMKRALRRHHRQRMIQHALRSYVIGGRDEEVRLALARRWHNHLKMCSCYMCGNPRKYEGGIPRPEQRVGEAACQEGEDGVPRGPRASREAQTSSRRLDRKL